MMNTNFQRFRVLRILVVGLIFSLITMTTPVLALSGYSVETQTANSLNLSQTGSQEEIESAKKDAAAAAEERLEQEAISAVEETRAAIASIDEGKTQDAIEALERATGKLDIILARDPSLSIVPVSAVVEIIDTAPQEEGVIQQIRNRIDSAIKVEDLPEARELLNNLISEVRTTTINLPLATYPDAMKEAARLLDAGETDAEKSVLQTALSTLIGTEESRPIPIINARLTALGAAAIAEVDQQDALTLLEATRTQLKISQALGYAKSDRDYRDIERTLGDLERQIKSGSSATEATFAKLLNKLTRPSLVIVS